MKAYIILKYFAIFIISISIISNITISILDNKILHVLSLRNVYLFIFLSCYFRYNTLTLITLIVINISIWYIFWTEDPNASWYGNPMYNFTNGILSLTDGFGHHFLVTIIQALPFILNFLITFIDIPHRIKKIINNKYGTYRIL